ncbi:hypothetical protein GCM10020358_31850 [Amorphoplanes nipponensis]
MAATLLAVTAAVLGAGSPAMAEPHADAKQCHDGGGPGPYPPGHIGSPYSNQIIYGTRPVLEESRSNASARGLAYLKKGDYFSIDRTNDYVAVPYPLGHVQFTTAELAQPGRLGPNFTWHYCEEIVDNEGRWMDRADHDGLYYTRWIDGAHVGIRLCITRPGENNDRAVCVGENTSPGGWYGR